MTVGVSNAEVVAGIIGYSSRTPGFDAGFKEMPEDFAVTELPDNSTPAEKGRYLIARIRLRNWDTNKFVMRMAREMGVYQNSITYAGTKDKFAVTVQDFCFDIKSDTLPVIKDAEVVETHRSDRLIRLGNLIGNRFEIKLRSEVDLSSKISEIHMEIIENGGFPNFYGLQRFGSSRPITHIVGKYLVKGQYEDAIKEYICDPQIDTEEYRLEFSRTGNAAAALSGFPTPMTFERALLKHILDHGYAGALRAFPRNLSILFVHAYQSYIFNSVLSGRIEKTSDLREVLIGDQVVPVDSHFNPLETEPFLCDRFNLEKLNRLSREGKVRPVISLPGYETRLTDSLMDSMIREKLESDGIRLEDFRIKGNRSLSSKGSFRTVSAMPVNFRILPENTVSFELGRGIYATVFLREFMKGKTLA